MDTNNCKVILCNFTNHFKTFINFLQYLTNFFNIFINQFHQNDFIKYFCNRLWFHQGWKSGFRWQYSTGRIHPSWIDYNLLAKIHEDTVREEVMDDKTEENAGNEDFLFDILDDPFDIFNLNLDVNGKV